MKQFCVEIESSKNHSVFTTQFVPASSNNKSIVISSATGVLQSFYFKFAEHFCSLGFTVYTFDYSGIGLSKKTSLKNNTCDLYDWANNQADVLKFAKSQNLKHTITLITHSIGGQLIAFNKHISLVSNIITVGSQSGYWKLFSGLGKLKMFLYWYFLIPTTTPLFGYFPAKKLRLFENLPKRVVYQWRSWGIKNNYFLSNAKTNALFIDSITCPILVLSFPNDGFAPKKTVDWLADVFKYAKVDRQHIIPSDLNIEDVGHFGFFRLRFANSLWVSTNHWIEKHS